jgi:integrase
MNTESVKVGGFSVHLWRASDGRWKWHTHKAGKRVLCAATTLDRARSKAKAQLVALRSGKAELADLSPALISEFNAWKAARTESPMVKDAVAQYLAHLTARKVKETRIVEADLAKFAAANRCRMSEVTADHVRDYLARLGVGPRRYNNVRSSIVSLFKWAKMQGLVPDGLTAPERTHAMPLDNKPVEVYTPKQFRALLAAAPTEWRLALAIGGLAGLRTEEVQGLRWEDIKLGRKLIEVRPEICKTGRRRLVPILPALASWIRNSGPQPGGMVAPQDRIDNLAKRLRRQGAVWVKNGLRHSFGSYRCAAVKSASQVALEMGNSETMVRKHYLEMQERKAATEWFKTGYFSPLPSVSR